MLGLVGCPSRAKTKCSWRSLAVLKLCSKSGKGQFDWVWWMVSVGYYSSSILDSESAMDFLDAIESNLKNQTWLK